MVSARSADASARIEDTGDGSLGGYQPLVVAAMTALILVLASVPNVALPLL